MSPLRKVGETFEALCRHCGQWRKVTAAKEGIEPYFVHWAATFICCGERQTALYTEEKDEIDVH